MVGTLLGVVGSLDVGDAGTLLGVVGCLDAGDAGRLPGVVGTLRGVLGVTFGDIGISNYTLKDCV